MVWPPNHRKAIFTAEAKRGRVLQLYVVDFPDSAASNKVVWEYFFQLLRFETLLAHIFTSFGKTAMGFRIDRRRNLALKDDAFFPVVNIYSGDRR